MAYPGYQNSLLLIQFREFYQELAQLKHIAINRLGSISSPASQEQIIPAVQPDDIWRRLLTLLESQAERASRSGGAFGFEVYREAQYVMAALADEFFLNENWPGRQNWPLLETRLFHTAAAGEVVFRKLDLLLLHRDPVYLDLAAIYFFALSLGFQGKFRGSSRHKDLHPTERKDEEPARWGPRDLERYKEQLFVMIFRHNPELLQKGNHIIPQTYLHTLAEGKVLKLPHPRRWLLVLAAIILVWLGVSHLLWHQLTGALDEQLQTIERGANGGSK